MGAGGGKLQEQLVAAIKANDIPTLNQLLEKNKVQKPQLNSLLHVVHITCLYPLNGRSFMISFSGGSKSWK
jgi:hypothetical protein